MKRSAYRYPRSAQRILANTRIGSLMVQASFHRVLAALGLDGHRFPGGLVLAPLLVLLISPAVVTAEPDGDELRYFEERVRPLLAERCYSCHGPDKQRGGLRVDSLDGLLTGGEAGPAIDPGKPEESLLVEAIRYESYEMPPTGKLPDEETAVLVRWISRGAVWPGGDVPIRTPPPAEKISDEDRAWWSFQPVRAPEPPEVDDGGWSRNELDRFVFRKLCDEGLTPAPAADRQALLRRAYFDLIGLPPTPAQTAEFLEDTSDDAYPRLIDRLLDSPRYGERWARHWLDLVRYAESDGYRQDAVRPQAWRYRDYVIRAFNEDKPYDRFVWEQLAGDELAPGDLDALDATAFLRQWIYEYNQRDVRTQWDNILIDVTNVTADVFLGLGMGCARCHDHKFDPILKQDYFALKAFFTPLLPRDDLPYAGGRQLAEYRQQLAAWEAGTAEIRGRMAEIERPLVAVARQRAVDKFPQDIRPMILKPPPQRLPLEHQLAELAERQSRVEVEKLDFAKQLKGDELEKWLACNEQLEQSATLRPPPLPPAFTVTDVGPQAPPTLMPGDRQQRDIPPGFLTVLGPPACEIVPPPSGTSTGRRTALARWIADPGNPLTARVMVNRVWQQHFGVGLVATPSDFGRLGELPSHPELLDWLAARFVNNGWRVKDLHRLIMNSATYRQSALRPAPQIALKKDPHNRWLWRMNVRRLDAEQIRDAMLAASGELKLTLGGPSVDSAQPRRSVYCRIIRNNRDPLLDAFDAADGFSSTDKRNVTTTPTQSLLMINGPWPLARARAWAAQLQRQPGDPAGRLDQAFQLAFGRRPSAQERQTVLSLLEERLAAREHQLDRPPAADPAEPMPGRPGYAAAFLSDGAQQGLPLAADSAVPAGDFTVESVILLRSLYEDASVRTIASQWDDNQAHPGWSLGVTSKKSAYGPRNVILQLVGDQGGTVGYEVVASGLRPELNKPYYVAVSVRLDDTSPAGVTFYLKDLSDPAAGLQKSAAPHRVTDQSGGAAALVIGGRDRAPRHRWDGLIDDVRLSQAALAESELGLQAPAVTERTVGFWQFELEPGFYADGSPRNNRLARVGGVEPAGAEYQAWVDVCHVLLNTNEFLYID